MRILQAFLESALLERAPKALNVENAAPAGPEELDLAVSSESSRIVEVLLGAL